MFAKLIALFKRKEKPMILKSNQGGSVCLRLPGEEQYH